MSVGQAAVLDAAANGGAAGRSRATGWPRRLAIATVAILVLLTAGSLVYNRLTTRRARVPAGWHYVQAGDVPTRLRSWGSAGSPVLLVHGFAESADTWAPVAELLAGRHRVYALDLDGWGYSHRVAPFDLDHQTRQLLAVLAVLGLHQPLLVGHSSGAAIVAEAALRAPAAVGGVLLLDGDALATGAGERSLLDRLILPPFRTTALRLALRSDALIRNLYGQRCGPRCPYLDAAGVDTWRRPLQVAGAEAALWDMIDDGVPGLSTGRLSGLASLSMPKSVVFGAQDDVFTPATAQQTATRIGAPAPTLLPAARHLTMISDPAPVAAAVEHLAERFHHEG